jgi:D-alanyl-D-alanine carboxypeptidase
MESGESKRPSYSFKLVKTDIFHEPDLKMYLKWTAIALFFGISSVSFVIQGVLVLKDKIFGDSTQGILISQNDIQFKERLVSQQAPSNKITDTQRTVDQEGGLGSDDSNNGIPTNQYRIHETIPLQKLSAQSYLVADLQTGEIIIQKNNDLVAPIASVSKLMTAVVAFEHMDMQKEAIVSRDSYNTYGAEGRLMLGEKIRMQDLMYPLLMESSNDGAEVIADTYDKGHDAFIREMNHKAASLGMVDTNYNDPSGLNPKNTSTVLDLMVLAKYIYEKHPIIYDITRVRQYSILKHTWVNKNRFLNYDSFMGGKNGYIDESKKTTVSLFNVQLVRGGVRPVILVLLKSDDREGDAVKLINYLKKNAVYDYTDIISQ